MLAGTTDGAEQLLPAIEAVGFDGRILAGDGATGIQDRPVNADGMLISSPYLADRESPANVAFVSAYRDAYQNQTPDHRGAGAYDIIYLLREALAAVGNEPERHSRLPRRGWHPHRPIRRGHRVDCLRRQR